MQDTVLNSIVTGVYVLTASHQGKINGSTMTWVTPVSYDPLLVMVSMADIRVSHGMVKQSGHFGLNVLSGDQLELARHFGFKSGRDTDKFEGIEYSTSENGLPVLKDACAYIECRVVNTYPAGDHTLFVGEVIEARTLKESVKPLIFDQKDFY